MNSVKAAGELLETLKEHEKEIARLYKVYAETFLLYSAFWMDLSKEETDHADWIEKLQAGIKNGSEIMIMERFPVPALEYSIDYVKRLIHQVQDDDFELIDALSEALRLEEALSESKYFEVLAGDSPETKRTLTLLKDSSRKHYEKVKELWLENRL